ncbi:hypothetical protein KAR26_04065 [Candidatus Parcubacteria bacterium]|nr:hypothetical protein [Candidatus Parcubacteria bacterium]
MNNEPEKSPLANKVLNKLENSQIKMRPKAYFVLKTVLIALAIVAVALFALYLTSFIVFALRASGLWYLPKFGFNGIGALITLLPWFLILIAALLIIVMEVLVKYFSFAYRRPILFSMIGIITLMLLGGLIIDRTQFHSNLFQKAQERRLPIAGELYRNFGASKFRDVHRGTVSGITDNGFLIETQNGQTLTIIVTPDIDADIKKDDVVVVLGKQDNGTVQALAIRKIRDNLPLRRMPMNMNKQFFK